MFKFRSESAVGGRKSQTLPMLLFNADCYRSDCCRPIIALSSVITSMNLTLSQFLGVSVTCQGKYKGN